MEDFLRSAPETRDLPNPMEGQELHFCYLCQAHCLESSKHCSQCDRCVYSFDHHCQWLNNCVGGANDKHFIMLLVFFILVTALHIASCILSLIEYFRDHPSYSARITRFYELAPGVHPPPTRAFVGLTWALMVADLAIMIFVVQLLVFHVYLMYTNQTTF